MSLDIAEEFARHGVRAIGHTSPEFIPQLAALVGPANVSATAAAHGFMILIRNETEENISRVCVSLPRINPQGRTVEGFINFRPLRFAPGTKLAFSPEQALTTRLHQVSLAGAGPDEDPALRRAADAMAASVDSYRFRSATVSLDSVWLDSRKVIGPERAGNIQEEVERLNALKEVRERLQDSTIPDDDLRALLESAKAGSVYDRTEGRFNRRVIATRGAANSVLLMWDRRNRADTVTWLHNIISQAEREVARIQWEGR